MGFPRYISFRRTDWMRRMTPDDDNKRPLLVYFTHNPGAIMLGIRWFTNLAYQPARFTVVLHLPWCYISLSREGRYV